MNDLRKSGVGSVRLPSAVRVSLMVLLVLTACASQDGATSRQYEDYFDRRDVVPLVPPRPMQAGDVFLYTADGGIQTERSRPAPLLARLINATGPQYDSLVTSGEVILPSAEFIQSSESGFSVRQMLAAVGQGDDLGVVLGDATSASMQFGGARWHSIALVDAINLLGRTNAEGTWEIAEPLRTTLEVTSTDLVALWLVTDVCTCERMNLRISAESSTSLNAAIQVAQRTLGMTASRVGSSASLLEVARRFEFPMPIAVRGYPVWVDVSSGTPLIWTPEQRRAAAKIDFDFG